MADAAEKRVSEADVAGHVTDVVEEVIRTRRRIIIERRGQAVAAIVPLAEGVEGLTPGERVPAATPLSEEVFAEFERVMKHVLASRQNRATWQVAEPDE